MKLLEPAGAPDSMAHGPESRLSTRARPLSLNRAEGGRVREEVRNAHHYPPRPLNFGIYFSRNRSFTPVLRSSIRRIRL